MSSTEQARKDAEIKAVNKEIIRKIAENYIQLEKAIVSQLHLSSQHQLTIGSVREEIWKEMFLQIVPHKFSVEQSVFIIDSEGNISNEVDLAIFDEQYTPYIFRFGKLKYIPIEAVAVVVQCKSTNVEKDDLETWVESITKLKTSNRSLTRIQSGIVDGNFTTNNKQTSQTATRPLRILCHLKEDYGGRANYGFDFVIAPKGERLKLWSSPKNSNIEYWYNALNHADEQYSTHQLPFAGTNPRLDSYKVTGKINEDNEGNAEITLLTLTFQINQLLMLINNPMFFPHLAYVEMFNRLIKNDLEEGAKP